ncbi:MAG TPA: copper resistance CopC family protein [Candidatus Dormibacteraeota bacterium]
MPALALAVALSLLPVPVAAHPLLVGATPPSGMSAPVAPARIVVSFTEMLDPGRSSVVVVSPDGRVTPWPSIVSGGTLAVEPPTLPDGTWRVRWSVTGSDGDRETGEYRFTVATPVAPGAAPPGPVEHGVRILLLALAVLLCGLLSGGAVLPAAGRVEAGRRTAALRSLLWGLLLVGLLADVAGLVAARGGSFLLVAAAGPPLLVAAGVTAALGVAVFDGGALRAGEPASLPTRLLGGVLGVALLAALVVLDEVPQGGTAAAVAGTLALAALATVVSPVLAVLTLSGGGEERRAGLARLLPRTVVGLALLGAAAALHPDRVTGASAITGALVAAAVVGGGGVVRLPRSRRDAPATPAGPPRAITLAGMAEPHLARAAPREVPRAPAASQTHPLPAGAPLHQGLSGHFVDLERLLETLEWSAFTGYVRIEGATAGVVVVVAGEVAAALVEDAEPATGDDAVRLLAAGVSDGEAILDVVGLDAETARAVVDLLCAPPLFRGLGARMVNLDGVLEDLCERRGDGSVVVRSPADTGVILVRRGGVHGAYTRTLPHLDDTPAAVEALARNAGAQVEVRIAAARPAEERSADPPIRPRNAAEPFWDRFCDDRHVSGLD